MKSRTRGFTLVELLVVMVVASILMMVAIPSYRQSVIKSRRADGKIALNDVAQRLERCYTQFGAYDAAGCGITDGDEIASKEGFYLVTVTLPEGEGTYSLSAAAQGAQADDAHCTTLEIDNTGVRSATNSEDETADDAAHCW